MNRIAFFLLSVAQPLTAQTLDSALLKTMETQLIKTGTTVTIDYVFYAHPEAIDPKNLVLLNTVLVFLKSRETLSVELGCHTDCRGNAGYNKNLSLRRCVNLKDWFVQNGISTERLTAVGYGEEKTLVECPEQVCAKCTEAAHLKNRRVSITFK